MVGGMNDGIDYDMIDTIRIIIVTAPLANLHFLFLL